MYNQIRFCNSSVSNFNASIGWGGQESRFTVSLVDDYASGDTFISPPIGSPQLFAAYTWAFSGIVDRWSSSGSVSGYLLYEVSMTDPRILLDGVQVILSNYTGPTGGVPNLINAYGYLEQEDFGSSKLNESGIPWNILRPVVENLSDGIISFAGYKYNIDLSALPKLPDEYRIPGPSMSLMELIDEVCSTGCCEYFVKLENDLKTIKVYTISRSTPPLVGVISQYINSIQGATVKEIGLELVNEVNSKFVVGANKLDIFYTFLDPFDEDWDTSFDNTIWPYWGKTSEGKIILGEGLGDDHSFAIDARAVLIPGVGNEYFTDAGEMRAALKDQSTWETYLWTKCFNQYVIDQEGDQTANYQEFRNGDFFDTGIAYKHSGKLNNHFLKAQKFQQLAGIASPTIISKMLNSTTAQQILNMPVSQLSSTISAFTKANGETENIIEQLYERVRSFASEYYGVKFMVRLPEVEWYKDPDTNNIFLSHQIAEAGFLDNQSIEDGIQNNLLPPDINQVLTQDGKITAFVRFDNIENLDLSFINYEDLIFGYQTRKRSGSRYEGTQSVFIRCDVEPDYVYLDEETGESPRAVITLPAPVVQKSQDTNDTKVIVAFINELFSRKSLENPSGGFNDANRTKLIQNVLFSTALANASLFPQAVLPNVAAIPLQSHTQTYGPWYNASSDGKIEFEFDETLAPWNYNGDFDLMNQSAMAKIAILGKQQFAEYGRVETPGYPTFDLGVQLLSNGPYVSDIQSSFNVSQGYTTVYSFKVWTPRFDKINTYWRNRIQSLARRDQMNAHRIRELIKYRNMKKKYGNTTKSN